jgi:hypothetical protein
VTVRQQMVIDPGTVVVRNRDKIAADMHGEVVMISLERGNYYGLGDTGSLIWQRIARPVSVAELCEGLRSDFDVDAAVCEADVVEFLRDLAREGLIVVGREAAE